MKTIPKIGPAVACAVYFNDNFKLCVLEDDKVYGILVDICEEAQKKNCDKEGLKTLVTAI